jgi:hypothetical protein
MRIAGVPMCKSAKSHTKEPRRDDHPRNFILDYSDDFCKTVVAKSFLHEGQFSRQIDILDPVDALGAPVHGDFIPQVAHAYRMSGLKGLKRAFQTASETSVDEYGPQGLNREVPTVPDHGKLMRCQVLEGIWKNKDKSGGDRIPLRESFALSKEWV